MELRSKRYTIENLLWKEGRWNDLSPWNRRTPLKKHKYQAVADLFKGPTSTSAIFEIKYKPGYLVYWEPTSSPDVQECLSGQAKQANCPHARHTCEPER